MTSLVPLTLGLVAFLGGEECRKAALADRLVVHEWGTFTSYSGSDGVQLEFRTPISDGLPEFVLDRARWAGLALPQVGKSVPALQRMETPVIYFYSARPREVSVRVDFPNGLLTEFYPAPTSIAPDFTLGERPTPSGSSLQWNPVGIVPVSALSTTPANVLLNHKPWLPDVPAGNPYEHARDTDSAFVRAAQSDGDRFEKFLFYRGVGNFRLPVSVRPAADGQQVTLINDTGEKLVAAFLFSDECCGSVDIRFTQLDDVGPTAELRLPAEIRTTYELCDAMTRALVRAGLYELEARAMIKTWRQSWFEEPGMRVFYILPRKITDAVLPLTISPPPDELVRVLVGRLEFLPQTCERTVEDAVRTLLADDTAAHPAARQTVTLYGRFAEAALRRVAAAAADAAVRARAEALADELASR